MYISLLSVRYNFSLSIKCIWLLHLYVLLYASQFNTLPSRRLVLSSVFYSLSYVLLYLRTPPFPCFRRSHRFWIGSLCTCVDVYGLRSNLSKRAAKFYRSLTFLAKTLEHWLKPENYVYVCTRYIVMRLQQIYATDTSAELVLRSSSYVVIHRTTKEHVVTGVYHRSLFST